MKNLCTLALLTAAGLSFAGAAAAQAKSAAAKPAAAKPAKPAVAKSGAASTAAYDDARKTRILENLKLKFPQLGTMNATLGELHPSPWAGMDEGSFSMSGPQGQQQSQKFIVTHDDKALFLVLTPDPINVSLNETERAAEKAKQDAEKAKAEAEKAKADAEKARTLIPELMESIKGLPARGPAAAPVTIIEFSDFQCPFCKRGFDGIEKVLKDRAADVKFVFKHSPLPFHPWAKPSAIAAVCATNQSADAFWILHDSYFNHQGEITPDNVIAKSKEFLASAKIDMAKWSTCAEKADSPEHKAAEKTVEDSIAFGQKHGVNGTPGFFVNGKFLNGAPDNVATVLTNMVDEAKGVAPAATTAPAPAAKKEDGKAK